MGGGKKGLPEEGNPQPDKREHRNTVIGLCYHVCRVFVCGYVEIYLCCADNSPEALTN